VTVSLIICTRNRASELAGTLENILPLVHDESALLEIIVVDNGSSDGTRNLVERISIRWSKLRYSACAEKGLSKARNHGAGIARGEILVWTDDDVRVETDWLRNLIKPVLSGRCQCTVGRIEIAGHLSRAWMTPKHRVWLAENIRPSKPRLVGANMAFTRNCLEMCGGFDPHLGAGALGFHEESLLGMKLEKNDIVPCYVDDAVIIHHFNPERLSRDSWITSAENAGTSTAHVCHCWDRVREDFLGIRLAWHHLMLWSWRLLNPISLVAREGIDLHEFGRVKTIAYLQGMRQLQKKQHRLPRP